MVHYLKIFVKWLVLGYLLLTLSIWLGANYAVKYFASQYLAEQNLSLADSATVRVNLITSSVSLTDLVITDNQTSKVVLSLEQLNVKIKLYPLIFSEIHLTEFSLRGFESLLTKQEESFYFAGISLPAENSPELTAKASPNAPVESVVTAQTFPYTIFIPSFEFIDAKLTIKLDEHSHVVNLQKLMITDVIATASEQRFDINLTSIIDDAPLNFDFAAQITPEQLNAKISLTLSKLDLSHVKNAASEVLASSAGNLSLALNANVNQTPEQLTINSSTVNVALEDLHLVTKENQLKLKSHNIIARELTALFEQGRFQQAQGIFSQSINELLLTTNEQTKIISQLADIKMPDSEFTVTESQFSLNSPEVIVTDLMLMNDLNHSEKSFLQLANLSVTDIKLNSQAISLAAINYADLAIDINKTADGQLVNIFPLVAKEAAEQSDVNMSEPSAEEGLDINSKTEITTQTQDEQISDESEELAQGDNNAPSTAFDFQVGEITALSPIILSINDDSVSPNFTQIHTISTFTISEINSQKPDLPTVMKLVGKTDAYTSYEVDIVSKPLSENQETEIKTQLKELNLPDISTYIEQALAYEIESGHLDLNLDANIISGQLNGKANIKMRGTELKPIDVKNKLAKDDSLVSFGSALNMLKDAKGNIKLSLPLTGNVNSPEFGLSGLMALLVKQATMMAAKDYLLTTFVPYANVVKVAMVAGDYMLKINIEPLHYHPAQVELDDSQQIFLDEFVKLLKDQPKLQVALCPIVVHSDIGIALNDVLTQAQTEQLIEIGKLRIKHFKDYMVNKATIDSHRLLSCKTKIAETEKAKPQLSFNL